MQKPETLNKNAYPFALVTDRPWYQGDRVVIGQSDMTLAYARKLYAWLGEAIHYLEEVGDVRD